MTGSIGLESYSWIYFTFNESLTNQLMSKFKDNNKLQKLNSSIKSIESKLSDLSSDEKQLKKKVVDQNTEQKEALDKLAKTNKKIASDLKALDEKTSTVAKKFDTRIKKIEGQIIELKKTKTNGGSNN